MTSYLRARAIHHAKQLASKLGLTIRKQRPQHDFQPVELALTALLADAKDRPVLVQIGASDGQLNDPISRQTLSGNFRCFLVEPVPGNCDMLRKLHRDSDSTVIQAAVGETDGSFPFYQVKNEGRWKDDPLVRQWGSFSPDHLPKHGIRPDEISATPIEVLSLASVVTQYNIGAIDALIIDAEGIDQLIVRQALQLAPLPKVIFFEESHVPWSEKAPLCAALKERGYRWIYHDFDLLCVHESLLG